MATEREELQEQKSLAAAGARFASQAGNTWEENSSEAAEFARVSMAFSLAAIADALTTPQTHAALRGDETLQPAREDPDPATEPSFCEGDTVAVQVSPKGSVVGRVVGVVGPVAGLYDYHVSLPAGVFEYPSSMVRKVVR